MQSHETFPASLEGIKDADILPMDFCPLLLPIVAAWN